MKTRWTLADILDTELFFSRDDQLIEEGREADLQQRDRSLYLENAGTFTDPPATKELARRWLAARRREHPPPLPGQLWTETTRLATGLLFVLSLLLGLTLATSFLAYDGATPVNVSGFFAFFILLQLFFLVLQILFFSLRLTAGKGLQASLLYNLAASALKRLLVRLYHRSRRHFGAGTHLDVAAAVGRLRQNRQLYGALFVWPAFILLQICAIGFNLGVLVSLGYKVGFTDIAFGWQSTLPVSEPLLAEVVRVLALPWAWLTGSAALYPDLAQISGSRIILKDGIRQLTTDNLTAWWPFLVAGVITYGLLPRLLLAILGRWRLTAKLRQLPFDSAHFRQLRRRMLTPSVQITADHSIAPMAAAPPADAAASGPRQPGTGGGNWLLLVPDELWDSCQPQQIRPFLYQLTADDILTPWRYGAESQDQERFTRQLATEIQRQPPTGILLIQEAWQPPIREVTWFLRQLRQLAPPATPMAVILLGKPQQDTAITPAATVDLSVWHKTLKTLGDPYLEVFPLVQAHD